MNGDHCAFCGKPRWLLERLHSDLTTIPVHPDAAAELLISFCAQCLEMRGALRKETQDRLAELDRLDASIQQEEEGA